MNEQTDLAAITELLRKMPKPSIPADLVAAIEAKTVLRNAWWESESLRRGWLPVAVGLATALGALWLSKIQRDAVRARAEMVAAPKPAPVTQHARLPQDVSSSETEKGESREHQKS